MALDLVDGPTKLREDKYLEKNKGRGLFIIVTNETLKYEFRVEGHMKKQDDLFPKDEFKYRKPKKIESSDSDDSDQDKDESANKERTCVKLGNVKQAGFEENNQGFTDTKNASHQKSNGGNCTDENEHIQNNWDEVDESRHDSDSSSDENNECQDEEKIVEQGEEIEDDVDGCEEEEQTYIIDKFKKAFNLTEDDDRLLDYDDEMSTEFTCSKEENKEDQKKKPFVSFIKRIAEDMREKRLMEEGNKPSFLMFVLLSAGRDFGQFLLRNNQDTCVKEHCKVTHTYTSQCNARRVSDLVRAIQEAEGLNEQETKVALFPGIPKIFLIQTISGTHRSTSYGPPQVVKKVEPDDYIPRGSDTFVFYAHTQESTRWVSKNGFYLLDKFCDGITGLADRIREGNAVLKQLYEVLSDKGDDEAGGGGDTAGSDTCIDEDLLQKVNKTMKEFPTSLQFKSESLCDGWLDNFCTTTAAEISQFLQKTEKSCDKDPGHYNCFRAHMSSTMRKRISMTDILNRQKTQDTKAMGGDQP